MIVQVSFSLKTFLWSFRFANWIFFAVWVFPPKTAHKPDGKYFYEFFFRSFVLKHNGMRNEMRNFPICGKLFRFFFWTNPFFFLLLKCTEEGNKKKIRISWKINLIYLQFSLSFYSSLPNFFFIIASWRLKGWNSKLKDPKITVFIEFDHCNFLGTEKWELNSIYEKKIKDWKKLKRNTSLKRNKNPISYKCIFVQCTRDEMLYNIVILWIHTYEKQQHIKFMDHILKWSKKCRERGKKKT